MKQFSDSGRRHEVRQRGSIAAFVLSGFERCYAVAMAKLAAATDRFVPANCTGDPDLGRRARLISRFGFLGVISGSFFAVFYFLIGHYWGSGIVVVCSSGFAAVPWLLRRTESLTLAGNLLSLILTLGFTALCFVEGGLDGHAIAWLAGIPLCTLLLLGKKSAAWWMIVCFTAGAVVVIAQLAGVEMRPTYDHAWHRWVSTAGYLGLILFMFILGAIFETGREQAFRKMQDALGKLETSNEQLVRLNQEKNEFLGIAAHDLKNPLAIIIGSAGLLEMNPDPKNAARLGQRIVSAGQRMFNLIKNLLDANAIEEGRFTSNLEPCDLLALVKECAANNLAAATAKEITLHVYGDAPLWARADRNATLQILDNLISNAVKYSPPKKPVHVRLSAQPGWAGVGVQDEGPGISEDDQKKLFQKFTRLTARPTAGESSNGLGLSIVKRLAEAMAGKVECQSALGAGATFTLRLPASDPAAPDSQEANESSTQTATAESPAPMPKPAAGKSPEPADRNVRAT